MRKLINWPNLDRYRGLLASETDERRRALLERLIAEEQQIWAGLTDEPPGAPPPAR